MPYISEKEPNNRRKRYNKFIEEIIISLKEFDIEDREGDLNYIISRIVAAGMRPETGWRYKYASRAHEVFVAAGDEFYRRLLAPYENLAIIKNGDIPEYADFEKELKRKKDEVDK